jgi:murein DD-endopeptidase MepM/ murein hydrolase activator NlpD
MNLGPVVKGDKSVLEHSLTHATSGLPLYPAFDTGWKNGTFVLAPERVTVTRHSGGSHAGWSIYATGESKIRYYITHLNQSRASVGSSVPQGWVLGTVGDFVGARVPHAHVGINVEQILGTGKELKHNTNYTGGQPTVGQQLAPFFDRVEDVEPWVPIWFDWYLNDRPKGVARPSSTVGKAITTPMWKMVDIAATYRADKPTPELDTLKVRVRNAISELQKALLS